MVKGERRPSGSCLHCCGRANRGEAISLGQEFEVVERHALRLRGALNQPKSIIASTDLDGLLSSVTLEMSGAWRVQGFFDSRDALWLPQGVSIRPKEHVFVDVFAAPTDIRCIDQHIVASNVEHLSELRLLSTKINPNLARGASYQGSRGQGFTDKYPFGTVHYVIALLEASGMRVDINLSRQIADGLSVIDLLLRADGAAENTRIYAPNCHTWWAWLETVGGPVTSAIADAARSVAAAGMSLQPWKRTLESLFRDLGCSSSDANFSILLGSDPQRADVFLRTFWDWFAVPSAPTVANLQRLEGRHIRVSPSGLEPEALLAREDLFTYAYTSRQGDGFSATLMKPMSD